MISNKIEPTKSLNEQRPAFGEKPLVCLFDPHDKRIHSLRSNDVKDLIQIVTLPTNFVLKRIKNNHESKNQNQHQLNIGCGVSEPKIQSNSHPGDYDTSDEDKIVDKRTNGTANDPHEMNRKSNISRNSDDEIRLSNKSDIIGSSNTKHNTNIIQSDHPITKNNNSNMIANCGDINVNIDQNNYNQTSFHIVHNNNENKIDQRPFHSYRYCPVNRSMTNIHNSSEISASSSSSSTTTTTDTNDNRSYMSNLNSVSIVSSSSNNIDQSSDIIPLSSLNTSALVRTISNGSTFGPLPSWSLGQSNCSDLANRSCFQNNPDHSNHFKPSNESGSSSNSNNNQVVGQSSSLCANNNIGSILATTFPAQNYPPVKLNLPLIFGENFILTGQIEASNLYRCIEMRNKEEYWCRVVLSKTHHDFLAPHLRMNGNDGVNQVRKIIIGRLHTFIMFSPAFGDLHSFVRNKRRLRESEAIPLFRQIVQIVADCHRNGVIIRDLKLRKFIFSDKEKTLLKLEILEGASLFDNDDDTLMDKHGCPAYVSPEILLSTSFSGTAADCWGMGVILYTMLLGRYPFHDLNPSLVFSKIRRGVYYIPDSLSKHAKCLIRSLMHIDPSKRLTADDALEHMWFQSSQFSPSIMLKRNQFGQSSISTSASIMMQSLPQQRTSHQSLSNSGLTTSASMPSSLQGNSPAIVINQSNPTSNTSTNNSHGITNQQNISQAINGSNHGQNLISSAIPPSSLLRYQTSTPSHTCCINGLFVVTPNSNDQIVPDLKP